MKNRKALLLVAGIVAAAGFTYTNTRSPHGDIPIDLRDAVAQEFDTGLPVIDKGVGNVPMPKPVADAGEIGVSGNKGLFSFLEDGATKGTPFAKVKNMFEAGVPAARKDVSGWHTGRDIYRYAPSTFRGALLVGEEIRQYAGGGPLFANEEERELRVFLRENKRNPGYYDTIGELTAEEIKADLKAAKRGAWKIMFPGAEGTMVDAHGKSVLEIRVSGDYLVTHWRTYVNASREPVSEAYSYYSLKEVSLSR